MPKETPDRFTHESTLDEGTTLVGYSEAEVLKQQLAPFMIVDSVFKLENDLYEVELHIGFTPNISSDASRNFTILVNGNEDTILQVEDPLVPGRIYKLRKAIRIPRGTFLSLSLLVDNINTGIACHLPPKNELKKAFERKCTFDDVVQVSFGEYLRVVEGEYDVDADIFVEEGGVLQVDAGAHLRFRTNCGLHCEGTLNVLGSEEVPVTFTGQPGRNWNNIILIGDGVRAEIKNLDIQDACGRGFTRDENNVFIPSDSEHSVKYGGGLVIANTEFDDADEKIRVSNLSIKNSEAERGGGIAVIDSNVNLTNIKITNCTGMTGGGIFIDGCTSVELSSIELKGNQAKLIGGGIFGKMSRRIKLHQSTLIDNHSDRAGGGVALVGCLSEITTESDNTFEGNTAPIAKDVLNYLAIK